MKAFLICLATIVGLPACVRAGWGTSREVASRDARGDGPADGRAASAELQLVDRHDTRDARPADSRRLDGNPLSPVTWLSIPAGNFTISSPTSEPCRDGDESPFQVYLTSAFKMMKHEVTQSMFQQVMGYNPAAAKSCGSSCPVESVTWHEAAAFCNALSSLAGRPSCYSCTGSGASVSCSISLSSIYSCGGYRLPTEAEWEYAYRAGSTTAFYNGPIGSLCVADANAEAIGWYQNNSGGAPHPIGGKASNAWQLVDLPGNVWEWVNDWHMTLAGSGTMTNPTGPPSATYKGLRGGSFKTPAEELRAANRLGRTATLPYDDVGFRCVQAP